MGETHLQRLDHLVARDPIIMITRQPPLRHIALEVLLDVVLIRREDPRSTVLKVDLHNAESRRVAWSVTEIDALCDLEEVAMEGFPVEVKPEVFGEVDADVGFGGDGVVGVFDLFLVDVDGDVCDMSFSMWLCCVEDKMVLPWTYQCP